MTVRRMAMRPVERALLQRRSPTSLSDALTGGIPLDLADLFGQARQQEDDAEWDRPGGSGRAPR